MAKKGLSIPPLFTKGRKAQSLFSWRKFDALIKEPSGRVHFSLKNVEAPDGWSQLAVEIAASKYFRRGALLKGRAEKSVRQLADRVVDAIAASGRKQKSFATLVDEKNFAEELRFLLWSQRAAFNSPVWFNCGLWEKYGADSEGEQWAWSSKKRAVVRFDNPYERPQVSACFIQSIEDSIEGIFELAKTEARLFKYGSGTGTNFSSLRSRYEELHSGGTSSGLISFLEVLDKGAGAIKSGGTTRRAAKMVVVDVDHPEIEDFVDWKFREEEKAKTLISAGYPSDFEGPAYKTVSGQNANNSVRVTDRFLKAVKSGSTWSLRARVGGKVIRTVQARELWAKMARAAWACADPGVQFHDSINRWHTCPADGPIRGSNPCSEYMFLDDSACNLASLNLVKFFDEDTGEFLLAEYLHAVRVIFIAQEILVDHASYPTRRIAENSRRFRPLGIGFANLGSLLMRNGWSYDSEEGRSWAAVLASLMTGMAYSVSAEMAVLKGPFEGFRRNRASVLKVLGRHAKASARLRVPPGGEEALRAQKVLWKDVLARAGKVGVRNAQASVVAPTGTIGLLMDCDTTGIEPDFALMKTKKLAGGGELLLVNRSVRPALRRLGYSEDRIRDIEAWIERTNSIQGAPGLRPEHAPVFACATGDGALRAEAHLLMMAAVQPFISGAISKTVNLPSSATVQDIERTFLRAWELGLKSVALYRDGSKGAQPLSARAASVADVPDGFKKCPECGSATELHSGCYRCPNCGFTLGCA